MTYVAQGGGSFIGLTDFRQVDATAQNPLGVVIEAADPYWGGAEFAYMKANGVIAIGNLVVWDNLWQATACPNTANLGRAVGVALSALVAGQFAWVQLGGQAIVSATASVAAGTIFGLTGAGTVGASTAGKEINNAVSALASATTVVKATGQTINGSAQLLVPNTEGWFVGIAVTGAGIPGGTTVLAIAKDNRSVTMSANATATAAGVAVTGTYTGFIAATINRPFAQGQIV